MDYSLEKNSTTNVTITVRAPYQELEPLLASAAARISQTTDIEGFRKGKAPYDVVRARVGEFKVLEEAARLYIEDHFQKILTEVREKEFSGQSFEPVGGPEVSITRLNFPAENLGGQAPEDALEFKIALTLLPTIELPDYRALTKQVLAGKHIPETTEKEVTDALEWLRESRAKLVTVNRGAKTGDRVEIDFSASRDGVLLENAGSENHPLVIGRGRVAPGFEDALIGMKTGEEKSFAINVPETYRDKAVAGKKLQFRVNMNLVQERTIPAWDDAFARSLGDFASAAAAEKNISDGLRREKEGKERERLRMAMADAIAERAKADIPDALVERELEKMLAELKDSLDGMSLQFDEYLMHLKKSEVDLKREWHNDALRRVKIALVLREISRREGIEPSEEDVQQAINRTVSHRGMTEEGLKTLDPVSGKLRHHVGAAAPSARAFNGVDREAFIRYHIGIARNEKVFEFLENTETRT